MTQISQLNRNLNMLTMEQKEQSSSVRDDIIAKRAKQTQQKMTGLKMKKEASDQRGDAKADQSAAQAAAAGIGIAAAVCACFPPIGTVIGAILAAVAAIIMLVVTLQAKSKEAEAAQKEQNAGVQDIKAEKIQSQIDDVKKEDETRRDGLLQMRQQLREVQKEGTQNARF